MYKRVLLKLSGEALSNGIDNPFCDEHLNPIAEEIAQAIKCNVQIGIVVGGGNIYRGKMGELLGMNRYEGDYMGMLATIMNSLAIKNALQKNHVSSVVLSSFEIKGIVEQFSKEKAVEAFNNNKVVIFGGGTGHPYFSTDTCSALRAIETDCDIILAAKNGVDGVYSSDPRKDALAKKFDNISYQEIIEKNLQVMDLTAISLCKENHMPLHVFNMNKKGNILKACKGDILGTIVQ